MENTIENNTTGPGFTTYERAEIVFDVINAMVDEVGPDSCTALSVSGKAHTSFYLIQDNHVDIIPYALKKVRQFIVNEKLKINNEPAVIYWRKKPKTYYDPDLGYVFECRFSIDTKPLNPNDLITNYKQEINAFVNYPFREVSNYGLGDKYFSKTFSSCTPCIHLSFQKIKEQYSDWINGNGHNINMLELVDDVKIIPEYSSDLTSVEQWLFCFSVRYYKSN